MKNVNLMGITIQEPRINGAQINELRIMGNPIWRRDVGGDPTQLWVPGSISPLPPHTVLETWEHPWNGNAQGQNGSRQQRTLPEGVYLLHLWAASGGGRTNVPAQFPPGGTRHRGGIGGYSRGILTLTAAQTLNIFVGGGGQLAGTQASGTRVPGGWNGGGDITMGSSAGGLRMGCGGGATDIRTSTNTDPLNSAGLATRFIVAGAGGGEAGWTGTHEWAGAWGGNGGGSVAQPALFRPEAYTTANGGQPGTQTSSPTTGLWNPPLTTAGVILAGFGRGGHSNTSGNNIRAGGASGWWGGQAGTQQSGGGGSGFVRGLNEGGEHLCTAPAWAFLTHGGNGHINWINVISKPVSGHHGHVRIQRIQLDT